MRRETTGKRCELNDHEVTITAINVAGDARNEWSYIQVVWYNESTRSHTLQT